MIYEYYPSYKLIAEREEKAGRDADLIKK